MLGIDIAKDKFDVALLVHNKFKTKAFPNSPKGFAALQHWLESHDATQVVACMEETGTYGDALALFLIDHGHPVSRVNPARIKAFAEAEMLRNKTDAVDAKAIARFAHLHQPEAWQPPAPAIRELQALVRRLDALKDLRQQEANRLDVCHDTVRGSLQTVITALEQQIDEIQRRIRDHIDQDPDLRKKRDLLESIPGIGEVTSAQLLTWLGEPERFSGSKAVAAFAGLTPRLRESGSSVRGRSALSKKGPSGIRKAAYMPSVVSMRHNPCMRRFAERLSERGKSKMVIIGAIMRKLLQLAYAVLKSGKPYDPNFALAA